MSDGRELAALAERFRRFAEQEARDYSPLYDGLCLAIAEDADLLDLAADARPGQPPPNLLLGAVHYLLWQGAQHPLRRFYPSLGAHPSHPGIVEGRDAAASEASAAAAFAAFRDFCLEQAEAIAELLRTRSVQTNEVGRSACLLPAFAHVASLANGPIALVEFGASAGLNLLCDRYQYDYGDLGRVGDPASPVRLRCRVIGGNRPPVESLPAIAYRVGVDLNPIDAHNDDDTLWLRALVWPEHRERAEALEAALGLARIDPPPLVKGDGSELLPSLLEEVPQDLTVCVFHSFVMHQVPRERRLRFHEVLAEHSWRRPVYEISFQSTGVGVRTAEIEMSRSVRGEWRRAVLAKCQAHGQSIEWLQP